MEPLQMVNLKAQYQRYKTDIDAAMERVCSSGAFIKGIEVSLFEKELSDFLGVKHVIGVANGTDALQIALMSMDLHPGDEVMMPSFAYAALPEVVLLLGLKPVFVDVHENTFLLDLKDVERKISNRTKVIAPVHLFGLMPQMDELLQLAQHHKLYVLEDAAQAIGSYYQNASVKGYAGTLGDIGITSFFPSKNLGCFGDGGAVFTNNDALAQSLRQIANHGQSKKYHHEILGVNSRLDTLQAAILRVKLPHLMEFNHRRRLIASLYNKAFENVDGVTIPQYTDWNSTHVFHQYTLKIKNGKRDEMVHYLFTHGIPSMIYYPLPLHRQKAYRTSDLLHVSEHLCQEVLSLPICPELTDLEQEKIINTLISFYSI
jgi:UDP-2-acetamido-2-deoxy-ribo-hexuluronate aminotransferase